MSEIGNAINEARTEIASAAGDFLPDVCNLWGPTFVDGGSAGDSETVAELATGIPIGYEGSSATSQIVIGGEAYAASHRLDLPRTVTTVVITPKHFIKVQPRGDTGELVFEKPVIIQSDTDVLLTVAATLVQQGFR